MKKILVIDDEQPTLAMFRLFLKAYGYEVLLAENGFRGLEVFRKERPPIVLTDIKMPGMDGLEVLRQVKEIAPRTEVIVISGHGDMDLAMQALQLNASDFLSKPVQKSELDIALKRAEERIEQEADQTNEIRVTLRKNNLAVLEVEGDVSSRSEPILKEAFQQALIKGSRKFLLRFTGKTSVNSAGVAVIIQLLLEAHRDSVPVAICGLSPNFKKLFEMVGVDNYARSFEEEEEALRYLAGVSDA
ncbi:MAG TPA: response regulator [Thermodesulfobacteriota bacterium]|nr:response regulator [Thermodesulfobacteriota bacterium]